MGWKALKEHYKIGHNVHVTKKGICIGSGYINDIIVIDQNGSIIKRYSGSNNELNRYQQEMEADLETLRQVIISDDEFNQPSITVYTYNECTIIEKQCEKLGWPNVTHDGVMMYDNTFSTDKDVIIATAKHNANCAIRIFREQIIEKEEDLMRTRKLLLNYLAGLEKLESLHSEPEI
ncbi:hypothetical protein [Methylomonas sp. AM2-LC]|uniref:hypothetical protein n=1 Tax=Methylomonas sp. AM2-LC TaxID=3153301 RepID=UPI003267DF23